MGCASNNGGIPLERGSALHDPGSGLHLRCGCHTPTACHGHRGQAYCTGLTLAEWLVRNWRLPRGFALLMSTWLSPAPSASAAMCTGPASSKLPQTDAEAG